MGIYKRKDSPFYWLLLERKGERPLREATRVRIDGGVEAERLARRTYDVRMLELAHEKNAGYHKYPNPARPVGWSYLYFLRFGDRIKIGRAIDVQRRLRELQVAHPDSLELLAVVPAHNKLEKQLHRHFQRLRVDREWFRAEPELLSFIARVLQGQHPVAILAAIHVPFTLAQNDENS